MANKDKLHYNPRKLDSYDRTWNFVVSEREAGKTTAILATKIYKMWAHHNRPSIILRRHIIDITETYITDLQDTINDFLPKSKHIKFEYKRGTISSGIVDVVVNGRPFCRFVAMNLPKNRIKSLRYPDPAMIILDEFILDNRNGEKYLSDEANRLKEIYNTFKRFTDQKYHPNDPREHKLKVYFCGNPYSVYNPYFVDLNVDMSKVKPGAFIAPKGQDYVVECYQLTDELRKHILATNPLYKFDNAYTRYAFGGEAINDNNYNSLIVKALPAGYKLKYIFRLQNKYLYVYHRGMSRERYSTDYGKFWICDRDDYQGSRNVMAVDFNNLIDGTTMLTNEMSIVMYRLKQAVGNRDITYHSISAAYLTEAIYKII